MIGTIRISGRFATAVALAAATAALSAPAALATDHTGHDFPGASVKPFVESAATDAGALGTDTLSSARVSGDGLDPAIAAAITARRHHAYSLPAGFQTDTVNSVRVVPAVQPGGATSGFDWASFAIGIGAGIGALLALGALAARIGRFRRLAGAS
jgi:hypothetical protein